MKWRHRGWDIFQAIEKEAKTPSGYANIDKVDTYDPQQLDVMPRFVLHPCVSLYFLLMAL